ncbi:hypothetical protein HanRHA438_Chr07g0295731 [Helianthus annuus]|uniref:uncharacterized protein LOC110937423 n=1 Tax=Helianthus annuus TaxID=4232 RepID=UPI000B901A10|nr:uncharacterized protein LOC110937423 [Helianthus annuus]KAJ0549490.1 hypothetical protein HanHA300_Chr07g0234291 [Helianthus annuus]KAJ0555892.1 hypothetical protein HanIR_Chr07g0307351 [Helianthus annuus]KAJ0562446.1 hypothetical protein HanHA89_Chr07g0251481 [Helianthus annuus]KAJ0727821.1 hypothetical protein HanLR1_Chr07g0234241 [Helianthus annuus]KAJ0907173.1 hypothetical protein HanRHA438_Chr07g0295731 [Helianthus annuus]
MFWEFVESYQIFAQITTTAQDQGDLRFPEMFTILERMIEALSQMIKESMNQHVHPRCQDCGGPHGYEDCPIYMNQKKNQSTIRFKWDDYYNDHIDFESYEGVKEEVEEEHVKEELPGDPELSGLELERTTDDSVPPPVQQDVTPNWYSTPWYYGPEPIDDDFWNDDAGEDMDEPLDKMEDENEYLPSWEEEFGDELVGLPNLDHEEFDPVGDLAYLETLLEEKPTMEIKQIPNIEEEKVAEELDSWPVKVLDVGLPPTPTRTREKARRKRLDQHIVRVQRWCKQKHKGKLKCRDNHLSRYMHCIRFGPGLLNELVGE